MKVTVAPNGTLRISAPTYAPLFMVKRMIAGSRDELRKLRQSHPTLELIDGMAIGKSHSLQVITGAPARTIKKSGQRIILYLAQADSLADDTVVDLARKHIITALRKEAKHYLPKRLRFLADQHGFEYSNVRFSHASGRWGSCNHAKMISLNIALMNLPFELIDYVLIHELAHTVRLDHSPAFWQLVEQADPDFKLHRKMMKSYSPSV
ncbi:MAG TPA: SprT family zinc-dependent metalloprotease [Candidatus Saccharibacteria bacterium]|nr:SprT family zinc-dependent metalloprotease [Candidatus Saccharibacteria bacterium]